MSKKKISLFICLPFSPKRLFFSRFAFCLWFPAIAQDTCGKP
jgi:hypothetical protein